MGSVILNHNHISPVGILVVNEQFELAFFLLESVVRLVLLFLSFSFVLKDLTTLITCITCSPVSPWFSLSMTNTDDRDMLTINSFQLEAWLIVCITVLHLPP